jgi:uncharacterized protein with PQ loop repeat
MIAQWLGYIGTIALMLSVLPQLFKTFRDGHCDGVSLGFLVILEIGMFSMLSHVLLADKPSIPLVINYICNGGAYGVMLVIKLTKRHRLFT